MNDNALLAGSGAALLGLGMWIIARQRRAAACAAHDARAGAVAMVLAAGCLIGGVALLQMAIVG